MIIDAKGKYGKFLKLGFQTNTDKIVKEIINKAEAWAPKGAKSYTISEITHTNYEGYISKEKTGYGNFVVTYYSTIKEGQYRLGNKNDTN